MTIRVQCPECGKKHGVADRLVGRHARCPSCDAPLQIPSAEEIEAARRAREQRRAMTQLAKAIPVAQPVLDAEPLKSPATPDPREEHDEDEPLFRGAARDETEMDMTPMVDVTFLLLIFFMVTAAFQLQKSIEVPNEKSDEASSAPIEPEDPPPSVTVQIDEFGAFLVLAPDWEREIPGKQNLIIALRDARNSVIGTPPSKLIIEAHVDTAWKSVVDAMDAGAETAFSEMEIMDVEQFD